MQIVEENTTAVILIDAPPHLELARETITVTMTEGVTIIDGAAQGQRGQAGANADASFEWVTQTFELAEPQQEFVLDFEPRAGSVFVYLNGLLERFWSLIGTTLILEDSALEGDTVILIYQKET